MFKQFLQDPSVPKKEKLSSLGEILKAMNVSETTSSLFGEPLNTGVRINPRAPFNDTGLVVPENKCMSYQLHLSGRDRHPPAVCKLCDCLWCALTLKRTLFCRGPGREQQAEPGAQDC